MNDQDVKKFRGVLQEELKPIKKTLDEHGRILNQHGRILNQHGRILNQHGRKLDALLGDVTQLQDDVKGIRDDISLKHSRNKREIDEIKNHLGLPLISDRPEV